MFARVTTSQRSEAEEAKLYIEQYAIPSLKEQPGFIGAIFLADREKQTGISITLWEEVGAAGDSHPNSVERRAHAARMTGAIFETADTYEVIAQVLPASV
ncbi:MAG TPA: hypothetical protein VGR61_10325 [Candidatus Dormibacteraeota bacterium]|nr:hypothetical protein [Candidatus Dormibacteraeota bacterium]